MLISTEACAYQKAQRSGLWCDDEFTSIVLGRGRSTERQTECVAEPRWSLGRPAPLSVELHAIARRCRPLSRAALRSYSAVTWRFARDKCSNAECVCDITFSFMLGRAVRSSVFTCSSYRTRERERCRRASNACMSCQSETYNVKTSSLCTDYCTVVGCVAALARVGVLASCVKLYCPQRSG